MNNPAINNTPSLESVQQRFEAWRNSRSKREPIPEPLWKAAVSLCGHYPITHICRRLRLSLTDLKKRLSKSNGASAQFMELDLGFSPGRWHVECERPDGTRLRFSGNGQPPAVEHLLLRFLS